MRNFANSLIIPFKGATGAQAITAHKKSNQPPQAISLDIPWRSYALDMNIGVGVTTFNGAVSIDLARGTVSNPLDIVKSVFIDNTNVDRPVYLRCEDTGQVVTCADGSTGFFPLLTFGEQFTLFTDNIIPLRDGNQRTKIIFSNASFDTFSAPELNRAQQLFRTSGASNFVTPVLPDKLANAYFQVALNAAYSGTYDLNVAQLLSATPNTQTLITAIKIMTGGGGANDQGSFDIRLRGSTLGKIAEASFTGNILYWQVMLDLNNLQIAVDGNQTIQIDTLTRSTLRPFVAVYISYAQITLPALSA